VQTLARLGQPQAVGAPIIGVAFAAHQVRSGQLAEKTHQRRTFDARLLGQRHLIQAAVGPADEQERTDAGAGNPVVPQTLLHDPMPLPSAGKQAVGQLKLELLAFVHAAKDMIS
jgi:hypothetical protein